MERTAKCAGKGHCSALLNQLISQTWPNRGACPADPQGNMASSHLSWLSLCYVSPLTHVVWSNHRITVSLVKFLLYQAAIYTYTYLFSYKSSVFSFSFDVIPRIKNFYLYFFLVVFWLRLLYISHRYFCGLCVI